MSGNDLGITILMLIVAGIIGLPVIAAILLIALKVGNTNVFRGKK